MNASPPDAEHPSVASLWPLLTFAGALMLFAIVAVQWALPLWASIASLWLAVGLLSWVAVLRYFSPTPVLSHSAPDSARVSARFDVRRVPDMLVLLIPIAAVAPFLLTFLLIRVWTRSPRKA